MQTQPAFEVDGSTISMYTNRTVVRQMESRGYTQASVGKCTRLNLARDYVRSTAVFFYKPNGCVEIHESGGGMRKRNAKNVGAYLKKFRVEMSNKVDLEDLFPL